MPSMPNQKTIVKATIGGIVLLLIFAGVQLGFDASGKLGKIYEPVPPGYSRVVEVSDGDTFEVIMAGERQDIRLVGVDTPETQHPSKPVQCFGPQASDFVTELIEGESVKLIADARQPSRDQYGRLLRYVELEDGRELNELLVREGYAFATNFNTEKKILLKGLETKARSQNKGLWSECEVSSPDGYLQTNPV